MDSKETCLLCSPQCASSENNSGLSTNLAVFYEFITHVMRMYYRREEFVRVLHRSEGPERTCHICEKFAQIIHNV